jgi:hypothetical protein
MTFSKAVKIEQVPMSFSKGVISEKEAGTGFTIHRT